jgi:hypothetical protein
MFGHFAQKKKKIHTNTQRELWIKLKSKTSHIFFHLPAFLLNNLESPSKLCNMSKLDSSSLGQENQCTGDHSKNVIIQKEHQKKKKKKKKIENH